MPVFRYYALRHNTDLFLALHSISQVIAIFKLYRDAVTAERKIKLDGFRASAVCRTREGKIIAFFILSDIKRNMGGITTSANLPRMPTASWSFYEPFAEFFGRVRVNLLKPLIASVSVLVILFTEREIATVIAHSLVADGTETMLRGREFK